MLFKKLAFPQEVQTLPEVNASLFLLTLCGILSMAPFQVAL